jgi:hypothetical protein
MVMILVGVGALALAILAWNIISTATDDTARAHVEIDYDSPAELLALAEPARRGDSDAPIIDDGFLGLLVPVLRSSSR